MSWYAFKATRPKSCYFTYCFGMQIFFSTLGCKGAKLPEGRAVLHAGALPLESLDTRQHSLAVAPKALDRGHTPAAYSLAVMHLNGIGSAPHLPISRAFESIRALALQLLQLPSTVTRRALFEDCARLRHRC